MTTREKWLTGWHWRYVLLLFVLLPAFLLVACGGTSTKKATITLENMAFSQSEVQLKVGQPVTLNLVNKDGYAHAFDTDEFDVHVPLLAEETVTVTFTPKTAGNFAFYCSSVGHKNAGMIGTLIVTP
jgi:plastocyanin